MISVTSATFSPLTGEDMESIIEENGGLGDWEEPDSEESEPTPRWLFPRFDGAQNLGTCPVEGEGHNGIHLYREECGDRDEDFSVDMGNMYLSRSGRPGYESDVETLCGWLDAPRNIVGAINLLGDPGTGKTALLEATVTHSDRQILTHLCTPDDTRDSLFKLFVGEGHGDCLNPDHGEPGGCEEGSDDCNRSPYTLGPIPRSAKFGRVLYLDEWMRLDEGVVPVLYPLADGRRFLPGGNIDGSDMEIDPGFRLVLSSNPLVRGATMPEPMASRCAGTTMQIETGRDLLLAMGIAEDIVAAWDALATANLWRPAIRELRVADYWLAADPGQAVSAFLPEHCPESMRTQVRATVAAILGGDTREDGRLVVS